MEDTSIALLVLLISFGVIVGLSLSTMIMVVHDAFSNRAEYYKDKKGEWRWRIKAKNGEVIGASSESYSTKQKAQQNCVLVVNSNA